MPEGFSEHLSACSQCREVVQAAVIVADRAPELSNWSRLMDLLLCEKGRVLFDSIPGGIFQRVRRCAESYQDFQPGRSPMPAATGVLFVKEGDATTQAKSCQRRQSDVCASVWGD